MHNTWKKLAAITAGLSLVASLAACGGSNSQQDAAGSADAASLTIGKPDGTISAENNNPYAVGGSAMQLGYGYVIYEPLGITNLVDTSKGVEPWLASKIDWSGDYKSVTLTARDNSSGLTGKPSQRRISPSLSIYSSSTPQWTLPPCRLRARPQKATKPPSHSRSRHSSSNLNSSAK